MLKKCYKLLAMAVVFVLTLSTVVIANPSINVEWDEDEFAVRKTLRMPVGTDTPYATFVFDFELIYVNGLGTIVSIVDCDTCVACLADNDCTAPVVTHTFNRLNGFPPSIDDVEIEFEPGMTSADCPDVANQILSYEEEYVLIDVSRFPHAGRFGFRVTENPDTNPDIDDCNYDFLFYSLAEYEMFLYISNCEDANCRTLGAACPYCQGTRLWIQYVTFFQTVLDDGTPVTGDPEKVDAADGGLNFENIFVRTYDPYDPYDPTDPYDPYEPFDPTANASLYVAKFVTGVGDQRRLFEFSVELTVPSLLPATVNQGPFRAILVYDGEVVDNVAALTAAIGGAGAVGAAIGAAVPSIPGDPVAGIPAVPPLPAHILLDAPGPAHFHLRHGESLHFIGLPIGTAYDLVEFYIDGYNQNAVVVEGGTSSYPVAAAVRADVTPSLVPDEGEVSLELDLEVTNGLISNVTENNNSVTVTNNRVFQTPMGVFLSNLPFVGLIALAVGAMVGFIVLKVRSSRRLDTAY